MAWKSRATRLPAPFLKRITIEADRVADRDAYPFNLPLFRDGFDLAFERPVTVFIGDNGVGKSTLLEGLAVLAGFDEAGGGPGYRPLDHSNAVERNGGALAEAFRAQWLPKVTRGWFFRAESFFSVARYLDAAAAGQGPPPDYLSQSHGEGFLRFFEERTRAQGLFIFDEPESALSPTRQIEFLRVLRRMEREANSQVLIATHSPILMAYPGAALLRLERDNLRIATLEESENFRALRAFFADPEGFVAERLDS